MICKWCGETLKTGAKTCKRCKRDIPAKSDCGGFYDLVPLPGTVPPAAPAPVLHTSAVPEPASHGASASAKTQGNLNPRLLLAGAAAVILILLVMVITLSIKLADTGDTDGDRSDKEGTEAVTNGFGERNDPTDAFDPTSGITHTVPSQPSNPDDNTGNNNPPAKGDVTLTGILVDGNVNVEFGKEHCAALIAHDCVYIHVYETAANQENEEPLAIFRVTLDNTAVLKVATDESIKDCCITGGFCLNTVNQAGGKNPMAEVQHGVFSPLIPVLGGNLTCELICSYGDGGQFTLVIANIQIQ